MLGYAKLSEIRSGYNRVGQVNSVEVRLFHVRPGYIRLGQFSSC
jgi:hypothetical protein